ncbi:AMP-binding protein [Kitasatospora sp. NPDC094015]|uniref:AMP-binding protein n=1 Tax=Kitasatospora sp. NPDC094015 TaxID=3155205 RepID=UPI00333068A4
MRSLDHESTDHELTGHGLLDRGLPGRALMARALAGRPGPGPEELRAARVALHFEGGLGDTRALTFAELDAEVGRAAAALSALGVGPGDRVGIYLPVIPEAVVAVLACTLLGAVPAAVFGLFDGARPVLPGLRDLGAEVVITADGSIRPGPPAPAGAPQRHGTPVALKPAVDAALAGCPRVRHVLVVRRTGRPVPWQDGRDLWWHERVEQADAGPGLPPPHPGGYGDDPELLGLRPGSDVYWCTGEVGWLGGRPYGVFGALAAGVTQVLCESGPPAGVRGRLWETVERYGVTFLHTEPAAVELLLSRGDELTRRHDLSGLRALCRLTGSAVGPVRVLHRIRDWTGRARAWESCAHPVGAAPQPDRALS